MSHAVANIFTAECVSMPAELRPTGPAAETFEIKAAMLTAALGMRQLGCNLFALPPGKKAFPFHNHHATEELFIILEGNGEFRLGDTTRSIAPGDLIACPAGGMETAHQISNNGEAELRYLALSTKPPLDIIEYPDSGKFRAIATDISEFDAICHVASRCGYWDGE